MSETRRTLRCITGRVLRGEATTISTESVAKYEHECSLCGVELSGDVSGMIAEINEARDVAAALAHAYLTDNRPPREALAKARGWLRANQEAADD